MLDRSITQSAGVHIRATCHGTRRWTTFLCCRGFRMCMDWMLQQVEGIWCFDQTEQRRVYDGFDGSVIWGRRHASGPLCEDNCYGNVISACVWAPAILGCETNEVWVREALSGLVKIFVRPSLSSGSNVTANEEICSAALVFLLDPDQIQTPREQDNWTSGLDCQPCKYFLSMYSNFFLLHQRRLQF